MPSRWLILAVLFLARTAMAFQFQSVAALSPLLVTRYNVGLAEIGLMIGLYLAPGVVVSIPGGAIAARFGDKRVVTVSMVLMLLGAALFALSPTWTGFMAGRVIGGIGGIALNVVMTKMVVDWFAGREISTALAIFINSWPVGIALALLILPVLAAQGGLGLAWLSVLALVALALLVFVAIYQPASTATTAAPLQAAPFPALALFLAGTVWALYNSALAMVFGFGPALLADRGLTLAAAGSTTSLFMIVFSICVPLGGIIADRTGRRDLVMMTSLVAYVLLMPLVLILPVAAVPAIFLVGGGLFALGAGPIVGLPAEVLPPAARAFGMGVYFALYYAWMMLVPLLAGALADRTGQPGIVLIVGALLSAVCLLALIQFRRTARTLAPAS